MTVFTPHQDAALQAVAAWLKAKPGQGGTSQTFRLFGYAGTGKTTLARHLAERVARLEIEIAGLKRILKKMKTDAGPEFDVA